MRLLSTTHGNLRRKELYTKTKRDYQIIGLKSERKVVSNVIDFNRKIPSESRGVKTEVPI